MVSGSFFDTAVINSLAFFGKRNSSTGLAFLAESPKSMAQTGSPHERARPTGSPGSPAILEPVSKSWGGRKGE